MERQIHYNPNKSFIDIRFHSGIAMPLVTHRHMAQYGQTWHHKIAQRRQRRTEPRPRDLYNKFCEDWSSGSRNMLANRQTHRQMQRHTDRQTDCNILPRGQIWTIHLVDLVGSMPFRVWPNMVNWINACGDVALNKINEGVVGGHWHNPKVPTKYELILNN